MSWVQVTMRAVIGVVEDASRRLEVEFAHHQLLL